MVAERIAQARHHAGLTQEALAMAINTATTVISDYETGTHEPALDRLVEIAEACRVNQVWMVLGTGNIASYYRASAIDTTSAGLTNRLTVARVMAGMTQADVAKAMGTSRVNIHRWTLGSVTPKLQFIIDYAAACGCNPAWLTLGIGAHEIEQETTA